MALLEGLLIFSGYLVVCLLIFIFTLRAIKVYQSESGDPLMALFLKSIEEESIRKNIDKKRSF